MTMFDARRLAPVVALFSLAACLAGCAEVGFHGAAAPARTQTYRSLPASPLPAGVDAKAALDNRPMRAPALAPGASCSVSSMTDLGAVAPNYGAGVGPVYLSGQDSWYAAGEAAVIMIDSRYSGPVLIRPFALGVDGGSRPTLAGGYSIDSDVAYKERQHGVTVVPALQTPAGALYFDPIISSSYWRAWIGELSSDRSGCFGLQVDGDVFTEFIVFAVKAGKPPPG